MRRWARAKGGGGAVSQGDVAALTEKKRDDREDRVQPGARLGRSRWSLSSVFDRRAVPRTMPV